MVPSLTKRQRSKLRELAGRAHARALARAMSELRERFQRWSGSEDGVFEVNDFVHKFHNETSRELYTRYVTAPAEFAVIDALRHGILRLEEVGEELVVAIGFMVEDIKSARDA